MTSADAFTSIQPVASADASVRKPMQEAADARNSDFANLLDAVVEAPEAAIPAVLPASAQPAGSPSLVADPQTSGVADAPPADPTAAAGIETNPLLASLIVPAPTPTLVPAANASPTASAPADGDAIGDLTPATPQNVAPTEPAPESTAPSDSFLSGTTPAAEDAASTPAVAAAPASGSSSGNTPRATSATPDATTVATTVATTADTTAATDAVADAVALQAVAAQSAAPIVVQPKIQPVIETGVQVASASQAETVAAIATPTLGKSAPATTPGSQRAEAGDTEATADGAPTSGKAGAHAAASSQTVSAVQASDGQGSNGNTASGQTGQQIATAEGLKVDAAATAAAQTTDALAATRSQLSEAARPSATSQAHPALRNAPEAAVQVYTRFVERFDGRAQRFEMRLDPAELGRVDVRIDVGADKRVRAVLAAHDSGALSDLMRGQKALERALADAGIDLADGGLTFELSSESGGSAGNGQAGGGEAGRELAHAWRGFGAVSVPVDAETAAVATPRRWGASRLNLVA